MIENSSTLSKDRIDFRNYVVDMREVYQQAGLVFFPSHYAGYGMTAVESMFLGTPTVSATTRLFGRQWETPPTVCVRLPPVANSGRMLRQRCLKIVSFGQKKVVRER